MEQVEKKLKLMGAFVCPHCFKDNLCACKTCKPYYLSVDIGEHRYCQYTPDGEGFICSYCDKVFHPDESLEVEYQQYKQRENELDILRAK